MQQYNKPAVFGTVGRLAELLHDDPSVLTPGAGKIILVAYMAAYAPEAVFERQDRTATDLRDASDQYVEAVDRLVGEFVASENSVEAISTDALSGFRGTLGRFLVAFRAWEARGIDGMVKRIINTIVVLSLAVRESRGDVAAQMELGVQITRLRTKLMEIKPDALPSLEAAIVSGLTTGEWPQFRANDSE